MSPFSWRLTLNIQMVIKIEQLEKLVHPNHVELIRIYTREANTLTEEITMTTGKAFDLLVEAEVGTALFGNSGPFTLQVIIRDFTDNSMVIYTDALSDTFGGAWARLKEAFLFIVPANVIDGRANHILEADAILSADRAGSSKGKDVSFVRSRLFTASSP